VDPEARPPLATYEDLARTIDLPLVRPDVPSERISGGLELAKRFGIACASVRPSDIDLAVRLLEGSRVQPGSVVGFPHGTETTATKLYEARDLLRRGAKELDVVVAIPNLLSREFQYVQIELSQISELCHKEGHAESNSRKRLSYRRIENHRLPMLRARGGGFRGHLYRIRTIGVYSGRCKANAAIPAGYYRREGRGRIADTGSSTGSLRCRLCARGNGQRRGRPGAMESPVGGAEIHRHCLTGVWEPAPQRHNRPPVVF